MVLLLGAFGQPVRGDDDDVLLPDDGVAANPAANDDANKNITLPTEVGDHKLKFRTHIGDRAVEMSYLLHLPPGYGDPRKKHPMLVFFHGVGECGTDLAGVYALGPMKLLREDGGNPTFASSCPFIVLCPQCPAHGQTWNTDYIYKACAQLIEQTIKKTRTDPDRVYATGLSMGGLGSWCVAELFLHEQDTIGPAYHDLCVHGPDLALEKQPALQGHFPFVVISPRLPVKCDWESAGMTQALLALVDHVSQGINIDQDRVSVSGINAGAIGAWKLASEATGRFSAVVPVMIDGQFTPGEDRAQVVTALPGRAFIKASESASIDRMSALIGRSRLDWQLTKLSQNSNALGDIPVYSDRRFLNWLAEQRRAGMPVSTASKS